MNLRSASAAVLLAACSAPAPVTPPSASASASGSAAVVVASGSAPSVAPSARAVDPAKAEQDEREASACLADPRCALDEARRLYAEALDRGSVASCELFYRGVVVEKDWLRARACFERRFSLGAGCEGDSPSLDRMTLATMLLDGQGGPKAPPRVGALLRGCYEDVSREELERTVAALPTDHAPVDFCHDVGGTTLTMNDCALEDLNQARIERSLARKVLGARLDASVLVAEEALAAMLEPYVAAEVESAVFPVSTGTLAPLVRMGAEASDRSDYAAYLRALAEGGSLLAAKPDVEALERAALAETLERATDPTWQRLIEASEAAFQRFLKAAASFETQIFGAAAADDARARLLPWRVARLRALSPE
ncbi:MAG: hypothetical protein U0414_14520 [Polyangiaceae bacterium]